MHLAMPFETFADLALDDVDVRKFLLQYSNASRDCTPELTDQINYLYDRYREEFVSKFAFAFDEEKTKDKVEDFNATWMADNGQRWIDLIGLVAMHDEEVYRKEGIKALNATELTEAQQNEFMEWIENTKAFIIWSTEQDEIEEGSACLADYITDGLGQDGVRHLQEEWLKTK